MITSNTKSSLKKPILIGVIAIFIIGLLSVVYVYGFKGNIFGWTVSSPKQDNTPSIKPSVTNPTTTPTTETAPSNASKAGSGSDPSQAPATQPDGSKIVNIAIISTNQTSSSYHLGVVIYSVQNSGTCTLTLSKQGSTTIVQTVGVQALPSSSTCKGFDIPMSQLSSGDWQANVVFSNPPYNGSVAQNIKIN